MPETDIDSTVSSALSNFLTDFTVDSETTDGAGDGEESTYQNSDWAEDYGYYLTIQEFNIAGDAKAT